MPFSILNERIDPSPPGPARPGVPATDKARLRRQARARRRRLDPASRQHAQARVAGHLLDALARYGWRHIGAYAATAAELDLAPFLAAAPAHLRVYLPAIVARPDAVPLLAAGQRPGGRPAQHPAAAAHLPGVRRAAGMPS